jgi:Uma2 family endonuclease
MASTETSPAKGLEPAWQIAKLFPPQGHWSESSYLSFTESLNQLVELVDGRVEVLEMPTKSHQKIVHHLLNVILAFLTEHRLGDAIGAPYRIRLRGETFREPDIAVYLTEHLDRFEERYGGTPDIVFEVVSDDAASRARDYEDKRRDYAEAGVPEYWIVDPHEQRVVVLGLTGSEYSVHGEFGSGDTATSRLLSGLRISVADLLQSD